MSYDYTPLKMNGKVGELLSRESSHFLPFLSAANNILYMFLTTFGTTSAVWFAHCNTNLFRMQMAVSWTRLVEPRWTSRPEEIVFYPGDANCRGFTNTLTNAANLEMKKYICTKKVYLTSVLQADSN